VHIARPGAPLRLTGQIVAASCGPTYDSASKGEGDVDATTVAMCDLEDRIASDYETGFSEQALRQLMKEAFLLEMERKCQIGEAILSGKVAPLAIHQ
jgi:hypothetical protein